MKKFLKWAGITLLGLVLIVLLASWIFASKFNSKFEKVYSLTPASVAIPTDSASIERGRTLSVGCRSCHDVDMGGKVFFDDPNIGVLPSSNLTRAKGSETEGYTDEDYVRALRHGLNKKGNPLMVMPSESITHLSDQDLGCLIAFIKTLPPIERTFPKRHFTYMSQVMAGAGMFGNLFAYDVIDHEKAKNITAPPIGNSMEYGAYVTRFEGCQTCHSANFGGGKSPDPVSPPVPDITKSGNPGKWSLEQFIATFRTGKTPEGKMLQGEFMPFAGIGALSDVEVEGLYNYIQSLPPAHPAESKIAER
ncbi:MAG: c-type cytochrome [Saprospiraceae bacterium]